MKLIYLILPLLCGVVHAQNNFRVCAYDKDKTNCEQLNKGSSQSQVSCVIVEDGVDCANKISQNQADFGRFYPEEAYLASKFINEETGVVAELRARGVDSNHSFETVVVVRSNFQGGVNNLFGKKYCHPGFEGNQLWNPRVRKELDLVLLKDKVKQDCNDNKMTFIEKELKALSDNLGDSCRPGPWTHSDSLDKELQKKYPKLCKLCDSDCSYNSNASPEQNAIKCLNEKNADFAYTSLTAASTLNGNDYKLLCKNGEVRSITPKIDAICSWRRQPWPLIVGKKDRVQEIQKNLRHWIEPAYVAASAGAGPYNTNTRKHENWETTFQKILLSEDEYLLNIFFETSTLTDFFDKTEQKPSTDTHYNCPMRWCVVSNDEKDKCEWLSQANLIAGVEPQLGCIQGSSIYDCFRKIKNKEADLISIDSNYGYLVRNISLRNVMYNDKSVNDVSSIIAVLPENSNIQSFSDLKDKNVCFPEYRGLAWISFIESARQHKVLSNTCDFGKSIGDFFSKACAPGAKDNDHYRTRGADSGKLCSLCQDNCEAHEQNVYFDNKGALNCITEGKADVAFIEKQAIDTNINDLSRLKVLCKDNTIKNLDQITQDCLLSETIDSEIVGRSDDDNKENYKITLWHMEELFGTGPRPQRIMQMFKKFNDKENLMFKSSVLGFDDNPDNPLVKNYIELFKNVDKCTGGAWSAAGSAIVLLVSCAFTLIFSRNA